MLFLWLALWTIAAILFCTDSKSETIRWGSATAFFSGCGGIAVVVNRNVRHFFENHHTVEGVYRILDGIVGGSSACAHYLAPYCLLLFSLHSGTVAYRMKWWYTLILFLPIAGMVSMYSIYPVFQTNYVMLTAWVAPYVLVSNAMLIRSACLEKRKAFHIQKVLTCLFVVPTTLFSLSTNFILPMLHIDQIWQYNSIVIGLGFIAFLYFCIKYGFLGVRVLFENQRLNSTLRALSSGTSLLNHSIKNEIGKINILAEQVKYNTRDPAVSYVHQDVDRILHASKHILDMVTRIHQKLDIITLVESRVNLLECMNGALSTLKPWFDATGIRVKKDVPWDVVLIGDPVHLEEMFANLFKNAGEAMEKGGELTVRLHRLRKDIHVEIQDTGKGISQEHLPYVLQPFYSTKSRSDSYGLGLSYCYKVMQHHEGKLQISSREEGGTTVTLLIPIRRMIQVMDRVNRSDHFDTEIPESHSKESLP